MSTRAAETGRDVLLVWAQAHDGVIGKDGTMPWHVPEDMAHFREVTGTNPVIMGRRTWDSLPERFRPLPGRRNIVVTRNVDWSAGGAEVANSVADAIELAFDGDTAAVSIIGGGQLYRAALPLATALEVTELDVDVEGDTHAPATDGFASVAASDWETSKTGIRYRFVRFEPCQPR